MTILGIDPGTATIGYALASGYKNVAKAISYGTINTTPKANSGDRLLEIGLDLEQIIRQFQPDLVLIEDLFYFKNQKTVIQVAEARGVLLYTATKLGVTCKSLTPLQVKQALTGYGRATKQQVQQVVQRLYRLPEIPQPDDVADALAIAWCGLK